MQELNINDIEYISGNGSWALAAWVADTVTDFCKGFAEGAAAAMK